MIDKNKVQVRPLESSDKVTLSNLRKKLNPQKFCDTINRLWDTGKETTGRSLWISCEL